MMKKQATYIDFLFYLMMLLMFVYGAYSAFSRGDYPIAGFVSLLSLLWVYRLWDILQNGLRAPTRFEWFKSWMNLLPVLVGLLGIGIIYLFALYGRDLFGEAVFESLAVMLALMLFAVIYFALIIYLALRAPWYSESDEAYKAGMKGKD
jgi:hypothetical protein